MDAEPSKRRAGASSAFARCAVRRQPTLVSDVRRRSSSLRRFQAFLLVDGGTRAGPRFRIPDAMQLGLQSLTEWQGLVLGVVDGKAVTWEVDSLRSPSRSVLP